MEELFQIIKQKLETNLTLLEDKPEETIDSTIFALWHKAFGLELSAEKASKLSLPVLSQEQINSLHKLINLRLNNIPLAHLTGRQTFMGIDFLCDSRALIPRKETEILANVALNICKNFELKKEQIQVFDVCCGSGNLGIALAHDRTNIVVNCSDLSDSCVELTRDNIKFLNLSDRVFARQSDLIASFESETYFGKIDLIVCNPPYISTSKASRLNPEILNNEPSMAFDGGMIGLKVIQKLIQESPKFLSTDGWLTFEVGLGQGPFIIQLCEKSNHYKQIKSYTDSIGNIRVIAVSPSQT